jgi:SAM-dependent methyltransferase
MTYLLTGLDHTLRRIAYSSVGPLRRARRRRLLSFVRIMKPERSDRVIDLGGTPSFWSLLPEREFGVVVVNLPGSCDQESIHESDRLTLVSGDATDLREEFGDCAFDIVFSNSVIEHVGPAEKQEDFARECYRLAPRLWVQTPSPRFPLEVHTSVPFYWQLPEWARVRLNERWKRRLPAWQKMVAGTRPISRERMSALFPDATQVIERFCGFEKSIICYRAS